jgi:hypothetical protein
VSNNVLTSVAEQSLDTARGVGLHAGADVLVHVFGHAIGYANCPSFPPTQMCTKVTTSGPWATGISSTADPPHASYTSWLKYASGPGAASFFHDTDGLWWVACHERDVVGAFSRWMFVQRVDPTASKSQQLRKADDIDTTSSRIAGVFNHCSPSGCCRFGEPSANRL